MNLSGDGIAAGRAREMEVSFETDQIIIDNVHGYQIRLARNAMAALLFPGLDGRSAREEAAAKRAESYSDRLMSSSRSFGSMK